MAAPAASGALNGAALAALAANPNAATTATVNEDFRISSSQISCRPRQCAENAVSGNWFHVCDTVEWAW